MRLIYLAGKNEIMKANWLTIVGCGVLMSMSVACENNSSRSSASEDERVEQSDTTYMESQDNNGQPGSDSEGGTVNETQGARESGYGSGNDTESDPRRPGSTTGDGATDADESN